MQKKSRPRSRAMEDETPQLRKAIKDRPREETEIIPQFSRNRAIEDSPMADTPQLSVVQRAVQLLQKGQQRKRSEIEVVMPHLGDALLKAKAKLLTKKAGELKPSVLPPRSISDIIEQIESKGLPTDLSPRLRNPLKLQMDAFTSRPQVSFGPVRRSQRRS